VSLEQKEEKASPIFQTRANEGPGRKKFGGLENVVGRRRKGKEKLGKVSDGRCGPKWSERSNQSTQITHRASQGKLKKTVVRRKEINPHVAL